MKPLMTVLVTCSVILTLNACGPSVQKRPSTPAVPAKPQAKDSTNPDPKNKRMRERINLGHAMAKTSAGTASTCSQFGLASKDVNRYSEISEGMKKLNLKDGDCETENLIAICESRTASESKVTIYTDIYFYAGANTEEAARKACAELKGSYLSRPKFSAPQRTSDLQTL